MEFIKISKMSGKLEDVPAINTNTLSNKFCVTRHKNPARGNICAECYSHEMLGTFRKNCVPSFQKNSDNLSKGLIPWDDLPRVTASIFRLHGHGELINGIHFENFVRIAQKNPECSFSLWTKRATIVGAFKRAGGEIPANLILIFSNPTINKPMHSPPKDFHRVFNNVQGDEFRHLENCTGKKCRDCELCYRPDGVRAIFEHVKKNGRAKR